MSTYCWKKIIIAIFFGSVILFLLSACGKDRMLLQLSGNNAFGYVEFSPDGLAIIAQNGSDIEIYQPDTGELLFEFDQPEGDNLSITITPDGQQIMTYDVEGHIQFWHPTTGERLGELQTRIFSPRFTPDGQSLLGSLARDMVVISDLDSMDQESDTRNGIEISIEPPDLDRSLSDRLFRTASRSVARQGGALTVQSPRYQIVLSYQTQVVESCSYQVNGQSVPVGAAADSSFISISRIRPVLVSTINDLETGAALATHEIRGTDPDPCFETVIGEPQNIQGQIVDFAGLDEFLSETFADLPNTNISGITMIPIESQTADEMFQRPLALLMSPDGNSLAYIDEPFIVNVWDIAANQLKFQLIHEHVVSPFAYAPDGRTLATASEDIVYIWDAATGTEIARFTGHTDQVNSIRYSPNSRTILTGSDDLTLRLWDSTSGRELLKLEAKGLMPDENFRSADFSTDSRRLVTTTFTQLQVWDVADLTGV